MFTRKYFEDIIRHIDDEKILLLVGARQVGKTTLMRAIEKDCQDKRMLTIFLSLEDPDVLYALNKHPRELFSLIGTPKERVCVFLDEVQYLADPSGFLKYHADLSKETVKIIASGSSAFYIDTKFRDSLAGRKWMFEILPLDFDEWLEFVGQKELITYIPEITKNISHYKSGEILQLYEQYILYGAYPGVALLPSFDDKKELLRSLVSDYAKKDALEGGVEHPEKYLTFMKLLAHQIGNLINKTEFANTLNVDVRTIERYLFILQKSYHIHLVRPFFRNPRKELTKMPKGYFYDMGIRNILVNSFEPLSLRADNGAMLENTVLVKLLHTYQGEVINFWRTQDGKEVDFVLPGIQKAIEVKMDQTKFLTKKYASFTQTYPEIALSTSDMRGSLLL